MGTYGERLTDMAERTHISLSGRLVREIVQEGAKTEVTQEPPKQVVDVERENIRTLLQELLDERGLIPPNVQKSPEQALLPAQEAVNLEMQQQAPADIPTTPQMPETTLAPMMRTETDNILSVDTPDAELGTDASDFSQTSTFALLKGVEGFRDEAYLGVINDNNKSGLTVGAGLDFGQHSKEGLLKMGVPAAVVDKVDAAGWVGLNADTVIDPVTGKPAADRTRAKELLSAKVTEQKANGTFPTFTAQELASFTKPVYETYQNAARKQYENTYGSGSWASLSPSAKAVLSTEKYHRGANYTLPSAMLEGARSNDAAKAAEGIKDAARRRNMKDWLKKLGMTEG